MTSFTFLYAKHIHKTPAKLHLYEKERLAAGFYRIADLKKCQIFPLKNPCLSSLFNKVWSLFHWNFSIFIRNNHSVGHFQPGGFLMFSIATTWSGYTILIIISLFDPLLYYFCFEIVKCKEGILLGICFNIIWWQVMLFNFYSQSKLFEVLKQDYTYQSMRVYSETAYGLRKKSIKSIYS